MRKARKTWLGAREDNVKIFPAFGPLSASTAIGTYGTAPDNQAIIIDTNRVCK